MCGIAGVMPREAATPQTSANHQAMLDALVHRGPDGTGQWSDPTTGLWLGHNRLAIIDLETGAQPMTTADGALVITFNGCIYNYRELAEDLKGLGYTFRTTSDTEVVLHAYDAWGTECVKRFNGMWAFALWDGRRRRLFCSRDRLGIKPFYYHQGKSGFVFASEPKALLASGLVQRAVDEAGLRQYLTFQLCLGPRTLFDGIQRLEPGHNLVLQPGGAPKLEQYWDLNFDIDPSRSFDDWVEELRELLTDAVRLRLRSDVAVGAHLSGGLDSSSIVATARALLSNAPLKTFTGAFADGPQFDERSYAETMAQAASCESHSIVLGVDDFSANIEKIMWHMDEPAAGPGVFPQYLVSKLASEHVKVVLGGQGGDEIFIGYARYLIAYLEECLKGAIEQSANQNDYVATLNTIVPNLPALKNYFPMLRRFWQSGLFDTGDRRYFSLMNRFADNATVLDPRWTGGVDASFEEFRQLFEVQGAASLINRILYFDVKTHLQALLQVEDRTSMAWGLESRVPLLDHRLVELMASIQPTMKFKGGRLKHLFLEAVADRVPDVIVQRQDKMGFPVPFARWCKGPLRGFVHETLGSQRARQRGIFAADTLLEGLNTEAPFGRLAWGALSLELWHQQFID